MLTSTGSVANLVKVIQSQLAARPGSGAMKNTLLTQGAQASTRTNRYAQPKLESLIELRIKKLGQDDPQRGRKAFRVFLEAVLLSQFGDDLVNDPKFYLMVDDIQQAMESDAQCQVLVEKAIAELSKK